MNNQLKRQRKNMDLELRLELIEQIQAEYDEEMQKITSRIEHLMEHYIINRDLDEISVNRDDPFIARIIAECEDTDTAEDNTDNDDDDDDTDFDTDDDIYAENEFDRTDSDDSNALIIVDDDDAEIAVVEDYVDIELTEHDDIVAGISHGEQLTVCNKSEYPKLIEGTGINFVVLGPNGTTVHGSAFDAIDWSTTPSATRSLLSLVFSEDILATHTLTGKPSPAFHGRERPLKMQLDQLKTADIIHCVLNMCTDSNERGVRASITTKCADTAKKFKRRSAKKNTL